MPSPLAALSNATAVLAFIQSSPSAGAQAPRALALESRLLRLAVVPLMSEEEGSCGDGYEHQRGVLPVTWDGGQIKALIVSSVLIVCHERERARRGLAAAAYREDQCRHYDAATCRAGLQHYSSPYIPADALSACSASNVGDDASGRNRGSAGVWKSERDCLRGQH